MLALSGWRALGLRKLAVVFALGAVFAVGLFAFSPQVRERFERTSAALTADRNGVDVALSGRTRIWGAALCMIREHPVNGVGARDFRDVFPACDPAPGQVAAWGDGPAFHAHQWVLEVLSETGVLGLLLWIAGIAMAWRAWRYAPPASARPRAAADDRAGRDAVPVQHPPRVLFHVLGRTDAAARGAVRRQPARERIAGSARIDVAAVGAALEAAVDPQVLRRRGAPSTNLDAGDHARGVGGRVRRREVLERRADRQVEAAVFAAPVRNSNTAAPDMRASWWVEVGLCAGWPKNGTYTLSPRLGSWSGAYHSNPPRLRWRAAPRTSRLANIAAA